MVMKKRRLSARLVPTLALLLPIWPLLMAAGEEGSPVHLLSNEKLAVRVMNPSHPERYNRGVRFTPVAAVLQVERDGVTYLHCPEKHDPLNDHAGLAAEFDLCIPGGPAEFLPSGYLEAEEGDAFLKIGVGALKKGKHTYNFFQQPELLEAAETTVEWKPAGAVYRQAFSGRTTPGYAYVLEASLSLQAETLAVSWTLTNTGTRPLTTRQYTHNFFRIADHDTGPGYVLSFPYDFRAQGLESGQQQEGREILFLTRIPKWINALVPYPHDYSGPNTLTLRHADSRRSIMCETSRPGLRTDIHARSSFISPEQFIELHLSPGETQTWKRLYTFGKE
jgi:hypothetical protein